MIIYAFCSKAPVLFFYGIFFFVGTTDFWTLCFRGFPLSSPEDSAFTKVYAYLYLAIPSPWTTILCCKRPSDDGTKLTSPFISDA